MDVALQFAQLFAQLFPSLISLYSTIQTNNQQAGLVPAEQLLNGALANAVATKAAAQSELDKLTAAGE